MSAHRVHPIFVCRVNGNEGCGHQHSTQGQAENCAVNILAGRFTIETASVVRIEDPSVLEQLVCRITRQADDRKVVVLKPVSGEKPKRAKKAPSEPKEKPTGRRKDRVKN